VKRVRKLCRAGEVEEFGEFVVGEMKVARKGIADNVVSAGPVLTEKAIFTIQEIMAEEAGEGHVSGKVVEGEIRLAEPSSCTGVIGLCEDAVMGGYLVVDEEGQHAGSEFENVDVDVEL
jgi:hypothetical protein